LFQRRGNRLFNGEGVGAGVSRRYVDLGRDNIRQLSDRQLGHGHKPANDGENGDNDGDVWAINEKFRHC
jgi:hypothetical protein